MKKGLFLLASVAMLMLAGCGESGGVTSASGDNGGVIQTVKNPVSVPSIVSAEETAVTTPKNLYGIADMDMGTPPALPNQ
jgi:hypothetical protein